MDVWQVKSTFGECLSMIKHGWYNQLDYAYSYSDAHPFFVDTNHDGKIILRKDGNEECIFSSTIKRCRMMQWSPSRDFADLLVLVGENTAEVWQLHDQGHVNHRVSLYSALDISERIQHVAWHPTSRMLMVVGQKRVQIWKVGQISKVCFDFYLDKSVKLCSWSKLGTSLLLIHSMEVQHFEWESIQKMDKPPKRTICLLEDHFAKVNDALHGSVCAVKSLSGNLFAIATDMMLATTLVPKTKSLNDVCRSNSECNDTIDFMDVPPIAHNKPSPLDLLKCQALRAAEKENEGKSKQGKILILQGPKIVFSIPIPQILSPDVLAVSPRCDFIVVGGHSSTELRVYSLDIFASPATAQLVHHLTLPSQQICKGLRVDGSGTIMALCGEKMQKPGAFFSCGSNRHLLTLMENSSLQHFATETTSSKDMYANEPDTKIKLQDDATSPTNDIENLLIQHLSNMQQHVDARFDKLELLLSKMERRLQQLEIVNSCKMP